MLLKIRQLLYNLLMNRKQIFGFLFLVKVAEKILQKEILNNQHKELLTSNGKLQTPSR